ncbi:dihydroorotase [Acidaminobacter hydrogenoformans]|uniref:Dihydroorotase n=1 Tax=Acidaminobacter hydrogenoformans DSM 2784 TaxID=1120920 RepID=A0A1G5RQS8_9FIRM|nr:amidohydrolase family protein [Acidaminobacter hydrogenoformans]SCZ76367.1 dihydroorotase [Acidaminobacter hydrogenoformans DSM 2784]
MNIMVKNIRLIDPFLDQVGDILIEDGKITQVGIDLESRYEMIDGTNCICMPSFVDLHAHFRDPLSTCKEDILSGSLGAVKGGYTFINLMYDSDDSWDINKTLDYVYSKNKEIGLIDVHQSIFIGRHLDENTLEIINTISDKVKNVVVERSMNLSNTKLLEVMRKCKNDNLLLIVQAEDRNLPSGMSSMGEVLETSRCGILALETGCRTHFTHVSSKDALIVIKGLKEKTNKITCDITPHHLISTETEYPVNPPLKAEEDIKMFLRGIIDGTIDSIATDHAPQKKNDMLNGLTGAVGIELAFRLCFTYLCREQGLSLNVISKLMSFNPSNIIGIKHGLLRTGYNGNLTIIDPLNESAILESEFASKCSNTPFIGYKTIGKVIKTIKNGHVIFDLC